MARIREFGAESTQKAEGTQLTTKIRAYLRLLCDNDGGLSHLTGDGGHVLLDGRRIRRSRCGVRFYFRPQPLAEREGRFSPPHSGFLDEEVVAEEFRRKPKRPVAELLRHVVS